MLLREGRRSSYSLDLNRDKETERERGKSQLVIQNIHTLYKQRRALYMYKCVSALGLLDPLVEVGVPHCQVSPPYPRSTGWERDLFKKEGDPSNVQQGADITTHVTQK